MDNAKLLSTVFLKEFINQMKTTDTVKTGKENRIVKINDEGVLIESKGLMERFELSEAEEPYLLVKTEWMEGALKTILEKKQIREQDFHNFTHQSSFLYSLFSQLPFVKIDNNQTLSLKQFTTLDLPGQVSHSFKFILENCKVDKETVLQAPFFSMIYEMIKWMPNLSPNLKRGILLETLNFTVVSSNAKTPIKESVAERGLGNTLSWLKHFDLIDEELNIIGTKPFPQIWWVNQGKSQKEEYEGGFLWAPEKNKAGISQRHHIDLLKAKAGDIVIAYAQTKITYLCIVESKAVPANKPSSLDTDLWEKEGNLVKVKYFPLEHPIRKNEIPLEWRLDEEGPFDVNGDVKMGYFFKVSKEFFIKLVERFHHLIPIEILDQIMLKNKRETKPVVLPDNEVVSHIYHYIQQKGFHYHFDDLKNVYLSLKSKPFLILSGISGTGKTKLVKLFAESLGATRDNGQFKLVPVRPDWSDGTDLIGYVDLKGEFRPGALTEFLEKAGKPENRDKPFFLLLDEMNLARVEYYFSDLLSIMETKHRSVDGKIQSDSVLDREDKGKIRLYDNVYFIGTVNMDETTHPFSKKVLDRANTIEFNDIQLDHFDFLIEKEVVDPLRIHNDQIASKYLTLKDAYSEHEELIHSITSRLLDINNILEEINGQFGYRVRDEICFYMIYNAESQLLDEDTAFDYQIMQKILPRITGNDEATTNVLKNLFSYCSNTTWNDSLKLEGVLSGTRYPRSVKKLFKMLKKMEDEGLSSFWLG